MSYPPSVFKTFVSGEILTASDLNSSYQVTPNTNIPEDIDDFSVNTAEMQTTADPYPAGSESLATALDGEISRLRYLIKQITGEAQWYIDPDSDITTIVSGTQTFAGAKTFSAPINSSAGTVSLPGYTFTGDTNSGIYSIGADQVGITTGGTLRLSASTTDITVTLPFLAGAGLVTAPSFSFSGDPNTGLYSVGADQVGLATGGTLRLTASTTDITSTLPFFAPAGAVGSPSLTFSTDSDTGLYSVGANALGFTTQGTVRATLDNTLFRLYTGVFFNVSDDGSAAAPIITWNSDPDTGFYRVSANALGFTTGGAVRATLDNTLFRVYTGVFFYVTDDGSATTPIISWNGDTNTGIFRAAADTLALAAGGATSFQVDGTTTAGQTRMLVYDVDNATLERVTVGAADSGGAGFKVLRIPN